MKTFSDIGINIPAGTTGDIRLTCPKCSKDRKKSHDRCLAVNVDKRIWVCNHCGWRGSLGGQLEESGRNKPYIRPTHEHVELTFEQIKWFQGRGISAKTINENRISCGQFDKASPSIKFVYFRDEVVINCKHRRLPKDFRMESGAELMFYRYDDVMALETESIVITEGELDALACYEAGVWNALSVPNGAPPANARDCSKHCSYLESAEPLLERSKQVILAVDNDQPGKKLESELARRIGVEKCWRVTYPEGCKDCNDVLIKYGAQRVKDIIASARPYPVEGIYSPKDIEDLVLHLYDQGEQRGLCTGWPLLDEFYTVKTGQMAVVTGIPSSGKSNWLDALMVNLMLAHGWTFAIFSPENWPIQRHIQSITEKITRKSFTGYGYESRGRMDRETLRNCIRGIADRFFFIMPEEDLMSVDAILEKIRITILRHGVKGVVIDPWNEIEHDFGGLTETQYISTVLGKIRRFARRNDVHIWIVAHPQKLTRDKDTGKYKPPTMYEISGGAHWRNKADIGICVHRPDMMDDKTDVYIQKVRFREIGRLGGVTFTYSRDCGVYTDIGYPETNSKSITTDQPF